jgi:hypothetical protein
VVLRPSPCGQRAKPAAMRNATFTMRPERELHHRAAEVMTCTIGESQKE